MEIVFVLKRTITQPGRQIAFESTWGMPMAGEALAQVKAWLAMDARMVGWPIEAGWRSLRARVGHLHRVLSHILGSAPHLHGGRRVRSRAPLCCGAAAPAYMHGLLPL